MDGPPGRASKYGSVFGKVQVSSYKNLPSKFQYELHSLIKEDVEGRTNILFQMELESKRQTANYNKMVNSLDEISKEISQLIDSLNISRVSMKVTQLQESVAPNSIVKYFVYIMGIATIGYLFQKLSSNSKTRRRFN
jgi:hypothetical protein